MSSGEMVYFWSPLQGSTLTELAQLKWASMMEAILVSLLKTQSPLTLAVSTQLPVSYNFLTKLIFLVYLWSFDEVIIVKFGVYEYEPSLDYESCCRIKLHV